MAASLAKRCLSPLADSLSAWVRSGVAHQPVLLALVIPHTSAHHPAFVNAFARDAAKSVCEQLATALVGKDPSLSLGAVTLMPLVMSTRFDRDVLSRVCLPEVAPEAPDSPTIFPIGCVEHAFAGAQAGCRSVRADARAVDIRLMLPQGRLAHARVLGHTDTLRSSLFRDHGMCILAAPGGTLRGDGREIPLSDVSGMVEDGLSRFVEEGLEEVSFASWVSIGPSSSSLLPLISLDMFPQNRVASVSHVVIGGTFDRLHAGHWKLITAASMLARDKLTIGVTSDAMVAKKAGASMIAPESARAASAREAALSVCPSLEVECPIIHDPMGPSVTDPTMGAIVVSSETASGADAINRKRAASGLSLLQPYVLERGHAEELSSSALRRPVSPRG
jgi:pantetheine-phosphate adenylyltransferase